jgi:hypothetical protein
VRASKGKAITRKNDPFRPKSAARVKQPPGVIRDSELDRDTIIAVKMVGQGEFGEVFLANHYVAEASVAADDAIRLEGLALEDGDFRVPVAVKTVKATVGSSGVKEFTDEAALQLELKHPNIAAMVGVCMEQKPYLASAPTRGWVAAGVARFWPVWLGFGRCG